MQVMKRSLLGLTAISAAILINVGNAQALVASPDVFGLDFRFNNPGARANAMGGAFIGLADDATAAYTNPAGLTVLTKPEVSVEYKAGNYTTKITDQIGATDYDKTASGLSFLSYAYPAKNTTVTIFRHQLMNAKADFTWHELDDTSSRQESYINSDTQINTLGVGLGTKLNEKLSLGLAVGLAQLDYKATTFRYRETAGVMAPNSKEVGDSSDNAEQYTASLLWNVVGELNLGLVYRQGPKFKVNKSSWEYGTISSGGGGTPEIGWRKLRYQTEAEFKVPDVYGLGLSYRFEPNLTVAMDANYVKYSQLIEEFIGESRTASFQLQQMEGFNLDDEWEFRLGLEYVLDVAGAPIALRGGYYYRPDHRVYYTGTDPNMAATGQYLTRDKDDHIGSLGVGFLVSPALQVDLAASYGRLATEGIVSLVYRFE